MFTHLGFSVWVCVSVLSVCACVCEWVCGCACTWVNVMYSCMFVGGRKRLRYARKEIMYERFLNSSGVGGVQEGKGRGCKDDHLYRTERYWRMKFLFEREERERE